MGMHCAHARFLYNIGLEQRKMWHPFKRDRFKITAASQMRELTEARKEFPWLAEGATTVQQGALRDLDRAFRNWWANPTHFKPPTYHSRDRNQGFVVRDLTLHRLNRKWAAVTIPKTGAVKFRLTRSWAEAVAATSARVTLSSSGQWFVSLVTAPASFNRITTGAMTGIDRGVAKTISTSDGIHGNIPMLRDVEQARFLSLQRQFSRQVRGSRRRESTKLKLNRLRDRLRSRQIDWVEKTTTGLVRDYDIIALEALQTRNMMKAPAPKPDADNPGIYLPNGAAAKAGLNRVMQASRWGALGRRIKDKASRAPDLHPVSVIEVDPRNTSRICYECGHACKENRESQAVFRCVQCGHTAHADTNAAKNILARAIKTMPPDGRFTGVSATSGCSAKLATAA